MDLPPGPRADFCWPLLRPDSRGFPGRGVLDEIAKSSAAERLSGCGDSQWVGLAGGATRRRLALDNERPLMGSSSRTPREGDE